VTVSADDIAKARAIVRELVAARAALPAHETEPEARVEAYEMPTN